MLKKLSLILGLFFILFSTTGAKSSSSCPLETAPSQSITLYIQNVRKVISNVNTVLIKEPQNKSENKLYNTGNDMIRIFNQMINWDGFFIDFDYYIIYPLFNDIPSPIKRDLKTLEAETAGIQKYLKSLTGNGLSRIKITQEQACKDVPHCTLQGDAIDIIGTVLKNNTELTAFFKQIVTTQAESYQGNMILSNETPETFIKNLQKDYGVDVINKCSNSSEELGARFDEIIQKITLNDQLGKDGIEKWGKAWKLLIGGADNADYAKKERELLAKELSRQGLPLSAQETMLKNLDDFNNDRINYLDNNFITSSFTQLKNAGGKILDAFAQATSGFGTSDNTANINRQVSQGINSFLDETEKNKITSDIYSRLDSLYKGQIEYASIESFGSAQIMSDVIKIHGNIQYSTKSLQSSCEIAVQVCNSQGQGLGNCGSCK